jgi:hypothetical protein
VRNNSGKDGLEVRTKQPVRDSEPEKKRRESTGMAGITSLEKSFDAMQPDEIDVEEIHYFFVNFHQKSKQFLSKMK